MCPPGRFSSNGLGDCTTCPPETYTAVNQSTECHACPTPAVAVNCHDGRVYAETGYWLFQQGTEIAVSACPIGLCAGGSQAGSDQCGPNRLVAADNVLCGQCAPGYAQWSTSCVKCEENNGGLITAALFLLWAYVVLVHLLAQVSQDGKGHVGIFFYFVQTFLLISPNEIRSLDWLAVINFSPHQSSSGFCLGPWSGTTKLAVQLLLVPLALLLLVMTGLIHRALQTLPRIRARIGKVSRNAYIRTCLSIGMLSYTHVCHTSLQFLYCVDVGPQWRVVFNDPSVSCQSGEYTGYQVLACLFLIFHGFLFPMALAWMLYRHRDTLLKFRTEVREGSPRPLELRVHRQMRKRFGIVYEPFRDACMAWQMMIFGRRLALAFLAIWLQSQWSARSAIVTFFNMLVLLVHRMAHPYVSRVHNDLETTALVLIVLASVLMAAYPSPIPLGVNVLLVLLLVVPVFCFVIWLVHHKYSMARAERAARARSTPTVHV